MSRLRSARSSRLSVPVNLYADCACREAENPSEVILLLHGYLQAGDWFLGKLSSALPPGAAVVAPNGPFPIPERKNGQWRLGFSWYFYDPDTDEYFVDMKPAVEFLQGILQAKGWDSLPLRIVGFSQGGYLAPFAGQRLARTRQVVGLCSEFLESELEGEIRFRMDSVLGDEDDIVDGAKARASHARLMQRGVKGEVVSLRGSGHRVVPETLEALKRLLLLPVEESR